MLKLALVRDLTGVQLSSNGLFLRIASLFLYQKKRKTSKRNPSHETLSPNLPRKAQDMAFLMSRLASHVSMSLIPTIEQQKLWNKNGKRAKRRIIWTAPSFPVPLIENSLISSYAWLSKTIVWFFDFYIMPIVTIFKQQKTMPKKRRTRAIDFLRCCRLNLLPEWVTRLILIPATSLPNFLNRKKQSPRLLSLFSSLQARRVAILFVRLLIKIVLWLHPDGSRTLYVKQSSMPISIKWYSYISKLFCS